jgi:hypothetical protein
VGQVHSWGPSSPLEAGKLHPWGQAMFLKTDLRLHFFKFLFANRSVEIMLEHSARHPGQPLFLYLPLQVRTQATWEVSFKSFLMSRFNAKVHNKCFFLQMTVVNVMIL